MSAEPEVAALVSRASQGDAAAWEALYRMLYPRLLGYACQTLDRDRAREAVSETMVRAVAGIGRFSWRGAGFEGWMFGILHHVVADTHRRDGRRSRVPVYADVDHGAEPGDGLVAGEEASAMRVAFHRLRPEEQELLYLRVVSGLSSEEVAATLGKRPGAVRMAQYRALERLRAFVEEGSR